MNDCGSRSATACAHRGTVRRPDAKRAKAGDDAGRGRGRTAQFRHVAADTRVLGAEAVVIDQVLPDRHRIAAAAQRLRDQLVVRRTGTRRRRARRPRVGGHPRWRHARFWIGVGGHLSGNCRFCCPFAWPAPPTHGNPGGAQYSPTDTRCTVAWPMRVSVQPRRPSASTCCCLSCSKTLPIPAKDYTSSACVNVSAALS